MRMLRLCFFLQLCMLGASQKTLLDSPFNLNIYRAVRTWLFRAFAERVGEQEGRLLKDARDQHKIQKEVPYDVPFPCNTTGTRSLKIPDSVHRLRPGDIDVIAAMGDSLIAGAGIFGTNVLHTTIENRGVTGPGGGQGTWRKYLTLPNILKEFNPKLIGYSLGDSLTIQPASQLNVAEIGAMSRDMPFMAKSLIDRIKRDSRIDFKNHWKLVTISIGANDFCSEMCFTRSPRSIIESHKVDIVNTLRILRDNLPRTLVGLIPPPHLKELVATRQGRKSLKCYITTTIECSCLFSIKYQNQKAEFYDIMRRWQNLEEEIVNYPEFHTKDFTVTILPILKNTGIPLAMDGFSDFSFMSADCFHISQKSNARFANGLWNNLLEPIGNKSESWSPIFEKFLCPTSHKPYLITSVNSRQFYA